MGVKGTCDKAVHDAHFGKLIEAKKESLSFHRVAGMRMRRLNAMLDSDSTCFAIAFSMDVLEDGRVIAFFLCRQRRGDCFTEDRS